MIKEYEPSTLASLYEEVAADDPSLQEIIAEYGYPPVWVRPNCFSTLVLTILEQQVSLASAYAAYLKLKEKVGDISPENILELTDEDLRGCYFSRQKTAYVRGLAGAIVREEIQLKAFEKMEDDLVRMQLKKLKGIGDWTVDIYLIHALKRTDVFPIGDLALVNAIRLVRKDPTLSKGDILDASRKWKPHRSLATMLFWHYYICKKGIRIVH